MSEDSSAFISSAFRFQEPFCHGKLCKRLSWGNWTACSTPGTVRYPFIKNNFNCTFLKNPSLNIKAGNLGDICFVILILEINLEHITLLKSAFEGFNYLNNELVFNLLF